MRFLLSLSTPSMSDEEVSLDTRERNLGTDLPPCEGNTQLRASEGLAGLWVIGKSPSRGGVWVETRMTGKIGTEHIGGMGSKCKGTELGVSLACAGSGRSRYEVRSGWTTGPRSHSMSGAVVK